MRPPSISPVTRTTWIICRHPHLTAHRITITSKQNIMTQKTPIPHPHFISASSIEENKPCSSLQLQFSSSPNYTPHNPLLSSVQSPVSPKLSNGFPCSQKSYEDHNFAYQRRHLCETAPVPPSFEEEVAQRVGFGQMTYIVSQSWLPHCIGQIAMSIEFQLRETIHKRPSTSPRKLFFFALLFFLIFGTFVSIVVFDCMNCWSLRMRGDDAQIRPVCVAVIYNHGLQSILFVTLTLVFMSPLLLCKEGVPQLWKYISGESGASSP